RDSNGNNVAARLNVNTMTVTAGGAINVLASTLSGNTVTISGNLDIQAGSKLSRQGPGVLKTGAIRVDPDGQLDITDGKVIAAYSGGSPLNAIKAQIAAAYHGGAWDGANGITSSNAAAAASSTHKTAIGYAEATALGISSFGGEAVGTAVLLRYTLAGDAD